MGAQARPWWTRPAAFFHRHPVLLLLALTPGIPEYLSGSSVIYPVVTSPFLFLLFLGFNLALYGPGVLLLREAWVRWGKGWGALLCFGTAYAFLEEGTALSTMFDPNASVVGALGHYGRIAGVNAVWVIGVVGVHIVLSVGLPLLLLGLALPETRGRSLLTRRQTVVAAIVYVTDIALLATSIGFWRVELAWIVGAAGVALMLWGVAYRLPKGALDPPTERPTRRPWTYFLLGLTFFPLLLFVPAFGDAARFPAAATGALELLAALAVFLAVERTVGRRANEPHLVLLALGTTLPIALFGLAAQLFLPLVLVVDAGYAAFFWVLWTHYRPRAPPAVPAGAVPT